MAQKRTPVESILAAIQTRKAAAKDYLTKTGDVVAQPEDIIEHIRYVI
jgi:NAD(P)H-hydrate repair Nnr-like enzyme with NAD(P)H-hydrate dehydratase domain